MLRNTTTFAMGAVVALVLGTGTAYAATGGDFRLGSGNVAHKPTALTNPKGTALIVRSGAGQPPLRVNRAVRVPLLNADRLDGHDSTAFALAAPRIGTITRTGRTYDLDADGTPDQVAAIATCPAGSQVLGGGGLDATGDGHLFWNAPTEDDRWVVASTTTVITDENAANLEATVRCWNPRADVGDSSGVTPLGRTLSPDTRRTLVAAQR